MNDTFMVGDNGLGKLPSMHQYSFIKILPIEFIASQKITVQYEGEEYTIWIYAKRNPVENSEFYGDPMQLTCELTDETETVRAFDSMVKTSCRW